MRHFAYYIITLSFLVSCLDGSQTPFDGNFTRADPKKELPFEKLVGTYELDKDSKKRYQIPDSISLMMTIEKDSSFRAINYIDYKDRDLEFEKFNGKLAYTNEYKSKSPMLYLRTTNAKFNGGGGFDIFYRKKDSAIALLVFTPMVPATKENNMKYIEADFLRYIKVKDSIKK